LTSLTPFSQTTKVAPPQIKVMNSLQRRQSAVKDTRASFQKPLEHPPMTPQDRQIKIKNDKPTFDKGFISAPKPRDFSAKGKRSPVYPTSMVAQSQTKN
jgi:hypothetical protein